MGKIIKIVWLCTFSDAKLRNHLCFPKWYWGNVIRKLINKPINDDYAIWDANARDEFEKLTDEFEIHIIAPHGGISHLHEFEENGLFFHIFWEELEILSEAVKRKLNLCDIYSFKKARKLIAKLIKEIEPDIIHVIGIENKFHSMVALDVPKSIPVIAQLQTLVSSQRFKENTMISENEYEYNSKIEKLIIERADYIWTPAKYFVNEIKGHIKPNAVFVNANLMLAEPPFTQVTPKEFDFVYWALDVSKTADLVLEAFAIASKKRPEITLDIVGGYDSFYKKYLDEYIDRLDIRGKVKFEGKLPTHDDVLRQIRKSRFALLPLKIDIVSGTIREAMANGLPVITTITPGTPKLNDKRECVLLSETGDHDALADNMMKLLDDENYAALLRKNSLISSTETKNNRKEAEYWVKAYKVCLENYRSGKIIPKEMMEPYF